MLLLPKGDAKEAPLSRAVGLTGIADITQKFEKTCVLSLAPVY